MTTAWKFHAVIVGVLVAGAPVELAAADSPDIESKRAAFRGVYPEAERGNWEPVRKHERLLKKYTLWPDLRASYLRAHLENADHDEVAAFLDQHGMLKPARELRYQFALHLADAGHHAEYLDIYRRYYRDLGNARLDCLALQAELHEGHPESIADRGLQLWLIGRSQDDACDPVFAHLRSSNKLSDEHYSERFALAVEERSFSLARYLSRPLPAKYTVEANHWFEARDDSLEFLRTRDDRVDDEIARAQLVYAIERIAFGDPLLAHEKWLELQDEHGFTGEQRHKISRHIALWAARRQIDEVISLLFDLPAEAVDTEVRRWMIRTGLRLGDWDSVLRAIASLPDDEQQTEEWQYWEAMALRQAGQEEPARARLEALSSSRSYYGFLASDVLGSDYTFSHNRLIADEAIAEKLQAIPALVRARELFHVGLEGRGRSEWDAAIADLRPYEKVQSAILAHQWGWHSRAIATASTIGEFDDLEIRYPLPWREDFEQFSQDASLDDSWVYGIARSESLFMADIRSGAGAVGVMQILPGTGRRIAREVREPYYGSASLTDKTTNIRLGTIFLKKMLERFDDNQVLATAAYNAGPLSVEDWLPDDGQIDARIWIENIPYDETRQYVRRVLTADTIFHWRLTGQVKRISSAFDHIDPAKDSVAQVD